MKSTPPCSGVRNGSQFAAAEQPAERASAACFPVRAHQLVSRGAHALLAAMSAAVFLREALFLRRRPEDLAPLSVLEDDLVAAREYLERPVDLVQLIEFHRAGLVERLEIRRVDEVGHRDAVHLEAQ